MIQNFLPSDTIDLTGLVPGGFTLTASQVGDNTVVTLQASGSILKDSFTITGALSIGGFSVSTPDGHGGTYITHA